MERLLLAAMLSLFMACSATPAGKKSDEDPRGFSTSSTSSAAKLQNSECIDPDLSKLASSESLMLCNGTVALGQMADCDDTTDDNCFNGDTRKSIDPTTLDPMDLPYGKTVAGVTGQHKRNCRGVFKNSVFNNSVLPILNDDNDSVSGADPFQVWDTISFAASVTSFDAPTEGVDAWGVEHFCDPADIEIVDTELGFSAVSAGTGSHSGSQDWDHIFYDTYSGLYFTDYLTGGLLWRDALAYCDGLNDAEDVAPGVSTDWRLPTLLELMTLYIHGISARQADTGDLGNWFWASSTFPDNTQEANKMNMSGGSVAVTSDKDGGVGRVLCVSD